MKVLTAMLIAAIAPASLTFATTISQQAIAGLGTATLSISTAAESDCNFIQVSACLAETRGAIGAEHVVAMIDGGVSTAYVYFYGGGSAYGLGRSVVTIGSYQCTLNASNTSCFVNGQTPTAFYAYSPVSKTYDMYNGFKLPVLAGVPFVIDVESIAPAADQNQFNEADIKVIIGASDSYCCRSDIIPAPDVAATPEPATLAMLFGALGAGAVCQKKPGDYLRR